MRMRGMIRNAYLWAHARSNGRVFTVGLVTPYARACGLSEVTIALPPSPRAAIEKLIQ